jgi:hypothetical protein
LSLVFLDGGDVCDDAGAGALEARGSVEPCGVDSPHAFSIETTPVNNTVASIRFI